jgi:hypothetical protein
MADLTVRSLLAQRLTFTSIIAISDATFGLINQGLTGVIIGGTVLLGGTVLRPPSTLQRAHRRKLNFPAAQS